MKRCILDAEQEMRSGIIGHIDDADPRQARDRRGRHYHHDGCNPERWLATAGLFTIRGKDAVAAQHVGTTARCECGQAWTVRREGAYGVWVRRSDRWVRRHLQKIDRKAET
jgi:hypothetical protein